MNLKKNKIKRRRVGGATKQELIDGIPTKLSELEIIKNILINKLNENKSILESIQLLDGDEKTTLVNDLFTINKYINQKKNIYNTKYINILRDAVEIIQSIQSIQPIQAIQPIHEGADRVAINYINDIYKLAYINIFIEKLLNSISKTILKELNGLNDESHANQFEEISRKCALKYEEDSKTIQKYIAIIKAFLDIDNIKKEIKDCDYDDELASADISSWQQNTTQGTQGTFQRPLPTVAISINKIDIIKAALFLLAAKQIPPNIESILPLIPNDYAIAALRLSTLLFGTIPAQQQQRQIATTDVVARQSEQRDQHDQHDQHDKPETIIEPTPTEPRVIPVGKEAIKSVLLLLAAKQLTREIASVNPLFTGVTRSNIKSALLMLASKQIRKDIEEQITLVPNDYAIAALRLSTLLFRQREEEQRQQEQEEHPERERRRETQQQVIPVGKEAIKSVLLLLAAKQLTRPIVSVNPPFTGVTRSSIKSALLMLASKQIQRNVEDRPTSPLVPNDYAIAALRLSTLLFRQREKEQRQQEQERRREMHQQVIPVGKEAIKSGLLLLAAKQLTRPVSPVNPPFTGVTRSSIKSALLMLASKQIQRNVEDRPTSPLVPNDYAIAALRLSTLLFRQREEEQQRERERREIQQQVIPVGKEAIKSGLLLLAAKQLTRQVPPGVPAIPGVPAVPAVPGIPVGKDAIKSSLLMMALKYAKVSAIDEYEDIEVMSWASWDTWQSWETWETWENWE